MDSYWTKNNELSILIYKKRAIHVGSDLSLSSFRCCYIKVIFAVFITSLSYFALFVFSSFIGVTYDEGRTIIYLLLKSNMQTVAWGANQADLQIDHNCLQVLKHLSRSLHLLNLFCCIIINIITIGIILTCNSLQAKAGAGSATLSMVSFFSPLTITITIAYYIVWLP